MKENSKLYAHQHGNKVYITTQAIDKIRLPRIHGFTLEQEIQLTEVHRRLLRIAMEENDSNEVACIVNSKSGEVGNMVIGTQSEVNVEADTQSFHMLRTAEPYSLVICHNHPGMSYFSTQDIQLFIEYESLQMMTVITNQGQIWYVRKTERFDYAGFSKLMFRICQQYQGDSAVERALKASYNVGVERN